MVGPSPACCPRSFAGGADRTVEAVFASAQQARTGDPVRIGGVRVGRIDDIRLGRDGRSAIVRMALDDNAGPLYARRAGQAALAHGARRRPTPCTWTAARRPPGSWARATIPLSRTREPGRGRGPRLAGARRRPSRPAGDARRAGARPARRAGAGAGAAHRGRRRAGGGAGRRRAARPGGRPRPAHPRVARRARPSGRSTPPATSSATSSRAPPRRWRRPPRAAPRSAPPSLAAPGVLARTESTVRRLDSTLQAADPLIATLHEPAGEVAPTLARLRPTVVGADRLLGRAVPLLRSLRPAVQRARRRRARRACRCSRTSSPASTGSTRRSCPSSPRSTPAPSARPRR